MLDRVLTQSKEVGTRDGIRMLAIPNGVGLLDDARPSTGGCPRDDWSIWRVAGHYLELGAVATIEDRAMVDDFNVGIDSREVSSEEKQDAKD